MQGFCYNRGNDIYLYNKRVKMNIKEEERRARLLKSRAERLPDIKKQFEEAQLKDFEMSLNKQNKRKKKEK